MQKLLFSKSIPKNEPKSRKRCKKSLDTSRNLAGSIKTICEKRVSSKKQKQSNSGSSHGNEGPIPSSIGAEASKS
jgi:hypothetical protein